MQAHVTKIKWGSKFHNQGFTYAISFTDRDQRGRFLRDAAGKIKEAEAVILQTLELDTVPRGGPFLGLGKTAPMVRVYHSTYYKRGNVKYLFKKTSDLRNAVAMVGLLGVEFIAGVGTKRVIT